MFKQDDTAPVEIFDETRMKDDTCWVAVPPFHRNVAPTDFELPPHEVRHVVCFRHWLTPEIQSSSTRSRERDRQYDILQLSPTRGAQCPVPFGRDRRGCPGDLCARRLVQ